MGFGVKNFQVPRAHNEKKTAYFFECCPPGDTHMVRLALLNSRSVEWSWAVSQWNPVLILRGTQTFQRYQNLVGLEASQTIENCTSDTIPVGDNESEPLQCIF